MKTLNEYLAMPYRMEIVEDREEGGFVVSFPELPGCITCGETLETAVANAQDAKKAWLEAALADGVMIQEPDSLEKYSGQFKLRMPRSLHRALAEHSQQEGISMNQYCVYLLAKNDALHALIKADRDTTKTPPAVGICSRQGELLFSGNRSAGGIAYSTLII